MLGTAALVVLSAGCGKQASDTTKSAAKPSATLSPTTSAATGDTGPVTWATYREVGTLDPIQAFDYPENTVITSMCDSLLQQQAGRLATSRASATKVDTPDDRTIAIARSTPARSSGTART